MYIYTRLVSFKCLRHSFIYTSIDYNIHSAFPLLFTSPCRFILPPLLSPLCSPFNPLSLTWNPPSCDRIRPPRSQVACKLTPLDPPPPQPFPFQIPGTPNTPRLTKTTSGTTRHLLSGTGRDNRRKEKLNYRGRELTGENLDGTVERKQIERKKKTCLSV